MKKLTAKEWIDKVQTIHDGKYGYDKVEYVNAKTKVIITCPIHGDFEQTPDKHQQGRGCPKCAIEYKANLLKSNTQEFIQKAMKIHGNRYDYSKVNYVKASEKVEIICPIHGSFYQRPNDHLSGYGCIKCANDKMHYERVKNTDTFIEQANVMHNNKYDYSKINYYNAHTKVCIICPIHGEFWQTPASHLKGSGCPICKESKGEQKVREYLNLHNINYIDQYEINIDKNINFSGKAYLDFYLPDYNIAIEYNGIQHYIPIKYFGGELKFNEYQIPRDNFIKNYCEKHNIKLIILKYTDDIENILSTSI